MNCLFYAPTFVIVKPGSTSLLLVALKSMGIRNKCRTICEVFEQFLISMRLTSSVTLLKIQHAFNNIQDL